MCYLILVKTYKNYFNTNNNYRMFHHQSVKISPKLYLKLTKPIVTIGTRPSTKIYFNYK